MLLPLPREYEDHFSQTNQIKNLSLYFQQGVDWYELGENPILNNDIETPENKYHQKFVNLYNDHLPSDYKVFILRRKLTLESVGFRAYQATTYSRLISGLGLSHPSEIGFLFDRLTSATIIPGSSIKGAMKAMAIETGWCIKDINEIFGPKDDTENARKGKLIVSDAFPTRWPQLDVDIMTPHYGKYYSNKEAPGDWMSPTPITFITIKPGTRFYFFFGGLCNDDEYKKVSEILKLALCENGIGGKTSRGYGYFKDFKDAESADGENELKQKQIEEANAKKRSALSKEDRWKLDMTELNMENMKALVKNLPAITDENEKYIKAAKILELGQEWIRSDFKQWKNKKDKMSGFHRYNILRGILGDDIDEIFNN